ncbi:hypothetical protein FRB96_004992 [Tulasnella sp. 330]|nr:hypothetical protein FRB96_004992 [Tulasnella sp. 330]KAG8886053.1 hypothetical protein FRB97_007929 [Tulasnella sp. 331]KAG8890269.1 hypothetical protein FRB98_000180 [Tulasnella sp. 332]
MAGKRAKNEEEDASAGEDDRDASPPPAKKAKAKKEQTGKKEVKGKKKAELVIEPDAEGAGSGGESIEVLTNGEGEKYIHLSRMRRATARTFKGVPMVDLREFYVKKGTTEELPGSKGISLSEEQWTTLKASIATIDGLFESLKEKK